MRHLIAQLLEQRRSSIVRACLRELERRWGARSHLGMVERRLGLIVDRQLAYLRGGEPPPPEADPEWGHRMLFPSRSRGASPEDVLELLRLFTEQLLEQLLPGLPCTPEAVSLLGRLVGMAYEDLWASTHQLLRQQRRMVEDLLSRSVRAQEEERGRIMRELHDGVSQELGAVLWRLQLLRAQRGLGEEARRELGHIIEAVRCSLRELRGLCFDLNTFWLRTRGFLPTLVAYVKNFEIEHGIPVNLEVGELDGLVPQAVGVNLFRIVQEALSNVRKHSNASAARVRLSLEGEELVLEVRDWGKGFDPSRIMRDLAQGGHFGVLCMEERARLLGGSFHVESAPGQGTRVVVRVPLTGDDLRPVP